MNHATNDTWWGAAPISTCSTTLFANGAVLDSKAMVFQTYVPLAYQTMSGPYVIIYMMVGCTFYYVARGQGLLHDKLFTELDMTKTHVIALLFWLLA